MIWISLIILIVFVVAIIFTIKRQKEAMQKVAGALKLQERGNRQLELILGELRRSNNFLSAMAGKDVKDLPRVSIAPEPAEYKMSSSASVSTSSSSSSYESETDESMEDANHPFKVYVGNVDYTATAEELAEYFSRCGQVDYVNIPVNRYTGRARGFGFVTFASREEAERAMSLNGTEFKGRPIQVNFAKERE